MRFLLREQPYEKPLSAGRLVFLKDGQPVGRVESWRLTRALEGYCFLRADVDERESSGRSVLYNALINAQGLVENLRYRFFAPGARVRGQLLLEDGVLTNTRTVNGQKFAEETAIGSAEQDQVAIWYPTVSGLTLLARRPPAPRGFTIDGASVADQKSEKWFRMVETTQTVVKSEDEWTIVVQDKDKNESAGCTWHIGWNSQTGIIGNARGPAGETVRVERNIVY